MKTSETIKDIAPALVVAMGQMSSATKDATNPFFKSKYATLASVISVARPVLAANGLCFMQNQGGITKQSTLKMKTRIIHSSGQWIETVCEAKPKAFLPQDVANAETHLRRYGLMAALGIPAEDDDGNKASLGNQSPDFEFDAAPTLKKIKDAKTPESLEKIGAEIKAMKVGAGLLTEVKSAYIKRKAGLSE